MTRRIGVLALLAVVLTGCGAAAATAARDARASATIAVVASHVKACIAARDLSGDYDVVTVGPDRGATRVRTFRWCDWPPRPWSSDDGYSAIVAKTRDGADYIASHCTLLELQYTFAERGGRPVSFLPPIRVTVGETFDVRGERARDIPHDPIETVVLHDERYALERAKCIR